MINTLVIERVFDAPVEIVWRAWTDPQEVKKWWCPKSFTCPTAKIDFRVGGKYHSCMLSPEGREFWSTGTYTEIIPLKKFVCTDSFADDKGNAIHASELGFPGMENYPMEMQITVTFEDLGGKTKIRLEHVGLPASANEVTNQGWNECLDKLAESLS